MAPLKFEDKIKEKLEQRTIKPSEDSWQKLTSKLDDNQSQKKESKKRIWYSVAAIFVGVLLTSIFVGQSLFDVERSDPQMVNNEEKFIKSENPNAIVSEDYHENLIKDEKSAKPNQTDNNTSNSIISDKIDKVAANSMPLSKVGVSSATDAKKESNEDTIKPEKITIQNDTDIVGVVNNDVVPIDSLVIQDKIANVVAKIKDLQKNNIEVTDAEIDQLLMNAQREIATNKIMKSNAVSASALLQDVENELDENFKQRVFEALKKGFQKVRTAVVERDN